MCEKNNVFDFTELSGDDGFDPSVLFGAGAGFDLPASDSGLPPVDLGGGAELIPMQPEEASPSQPETTTNEMTSAPVEQAADPAPVSQPTAEVPTDESAASEEPASANAESAPAEDGKLVNLFDEVVAEDAKSKAAALLEKLRAKPPVFSYAAIEETITDPNMTFDALRERMADDLPELEDRAHTLWTVEYAGVIEKITKPKTEIIFAVKARIEGSKSFAGKLKKRTSKEAEPVCKVKPTISAQKKGVLRPYKGFYESIAQARASQSSICYFPSGDGKLYELRRNEIGEFCTPANPIRECEVVRAGFTPALPLIPAHFMRRVIAFFRSVCREKEQEALVNVLWDREKKEYQLYVPKQTVTAVSVETDLSDMPDPSRYLHVADIHSHNTMPAKFSKIDDADERATRIYIVIGRLNRYFPEICCRISNGGQFLEIPASEVIEDFGLETPSFWSEQVQLEKQTPEKPEVQDAF